MPMYFRKHTEPFVMWLPWALFCKEKGHWFDPQSGHMPGLQVWSLARERARGNRSMFLSLSFSLPSPSLKINKIF